MFIWAYPLLYCASRAFICLKYQITTFRRYFGLHFGSKINISVVPVAVKVPMAKINGSTNIAQTENDSIYTSSFVMPTKGTVLEINSEPSDLPDIHKDCPCFNAIAEYKYI